VTQPYLYADLQSA